MSDDKTQTTDEQNQEVTAQAETAKADTPVKLFADAEPPAPPPDFSAIGTLKTGILVTAKNIVPFFLIALIVYLPVLIYGYMTFGGEPDIGNWERQVYTFVVLLVVFQYLLVGAITYGVFQALRGRPVGIGESIGVGLSRLLSIVGVTVLSTLCISIGLMMFLVPGVLLKVALWVAIPVAIVERPGIVNSLKKSIFLTSYFAWRVFFLVLLVFAIEKGSAEFLEYTFVKNAESYTDIQMFFGGLILSSFLVGIFSSVIFTVGYVNLRVAKDDISQEALLESIAR